MSRPCAQRRQQLARIHLAKKQLGLDDETYRSLLLRVGGHSSSADMNPSQRNAVIREFLRLGFKEERKVQQRKRWPGEPKNCDAVPLLRKVRALLTDKRRPWSYAHKLGERMFNVKRVEWLREDQLHSLVSALQI
ncbi:MAG TPA: regulatory protein GemA, partial [Pseudoxanthomonas sp.]|nr:regulatory protein GemA [Pseudoxanthomonas sp.]